MSRPRCTSAKQRAYRQARMDECMDRWYKSRALHDALDAIEAEYPPEVRARVGMMLVGGIKTHDGGK